MSADIDAIRADLSAGRALYDAGHVRALLAAFDASERMCTALDEEQTRADQARRAALEEAIGVVEAKAAEWRALVPLMRDVDRERAVVYAEHAAAIGLVIDALRALLDTPVRPAGPSASEG